MEFKKLNNIAGWLCFAIATIVYFLTVEPTTSLWDCGEFIATSYKLQVGHPPGAPLFMLISRLFSLFAFGNTAYVALMINCMSALCSSFTILFLFWTITHFARRIVGGTSFSTWQTITILGAGILGAMVYTFSDSFWFSAVEGEVYAMSSLFTAVVFWAMLKWEEEKDKTTANRWLVLIAYLMGLSIGVHLLNLLTIPALGMIYYFKKYKATWLGCLKALLISCIILAFILWGIIPGIVTVASWVELLFVNDFGLAYNSGALTFLVLLVAVTIWLIYYTYVKQKHLLNTIVVCFAVILLGYSSYATIVIRSYANPPIDEGSPENVFALKSYLNREQYGDVPLLKGPSYATPVIDYKQTHSYIKKEGRYVQVPSGIDIKYNSKYTMAFPRLHSTSDHHIEEYKKWANIKGKKGIVRNSQGKQTTIYTPTFAENLKFFMTYQVGHMYMRYFMWNFSGRQNDIQGHGGVLNGNWLSGIPFVDNALLGSQKNLPTYLAQNKARNKYYMLPLVFGLLGLFYQLKKDIKNFGVVGLLFFVTGIAIIVYLNQTPLQPRERDYAYAGSFYAFSIWIGLGLLWVCNILNKLAKNERRKLINVSCATIICLLIPTLMAAQNWDDHDRSNRYVARDFAYNYLMSCEPNAILFTYGDNDTFPLWYLQEVEGIRTDVRIVNLSLLGTSWYINQMMLKTNQSAPLSMSLPMENYELGTNEEIYILEKGDDTLTLKEALEFIASKNPETKIKYGKEQISYLPTKSFIFPVNKDAVIKHGVVKGQDVDSIVSSIYFSINKQTIGKSEMAMLDIITSNNWERPIHFTTLDNGNLEFNEYLQYEGFTYKLIPIKTTRNDLSDIGRIDAEKLYHNLLHTYKYGNIDNYNVLVDEHTYVMVQNAHLLSMFTRTAESLVNENKIDKAKELLNKCEELMPKCNFPINNSRLDVIYYLSFIEAHYKANMIDKGNELVEEFISETTKNLNYIFGLQPHISLTLDYEKEVNMHLLQSVSSLCQIYGQEELSSKAFNKLIPYYKMYDEE